MKKRSRIFIILTLIMALAVSGFTGCSKTEKDTSGGEQEEVVLKVPHYKAGQNVGGKFFLPQVERFNNRYEGKYRIVIEEVPQDGYFEKIKQLAQQKKLPALIEGANQQWFEKVVIPNEMFYDFKPWLDSKPEIKNLLIEDSLNYNTRDGKIVTLPLAVVRPIGLYYNQRMMKPDRAIRDMTLEEFRDVLGENKVAFMTAENAWTVSLFSTAIMAGQEGGEEILKEGVSNPITDYTTKQWINTFEVLQEFLQETASSNTIGAAYADAANAFMSKKAAVIPNGPWMVGDFAPEAKDKWSNGFTGEQVRADIYPGNVAIARIAAYNWWIPSGLKERELEAALTFLEFIYTPDELERYMIAEGGSAPNLEVSEEFKKELSKNIILRDLSLAVNRETRLVPRIGDAMPRSVENVEFGKLLPKLIDGTYTPKQFGEILSQKAKEAVE